MRADDDSPDFTHRSTPHEMGGPFSERLLEDRTASSVGEDRPVGEAVGDDEEMSTAALAAAALAVRSAAWALRLALQRIEVLLREQAFWSSEQRERW